MGNSEVTYCMLDRPTGYVSYHDVRMRHNETNIITRSFNMEQSPSSYLPK